MDLWHREFLTETQKRLEHKKRGAREGLPVCFGVFIMGLESEPDAELQLTHANGGTWGSIRLDVRDLARGGAAIHASVGGDGKDRVVEEVVGIEAELRLDALGDG